MTRLLLLLPIVAWTVGCGSADPLAGKSEQDIQAMQKAEQQKADDEEKQYNRDRKKANAGKSK